MRSQSLAEEHEMLHINDCYAWKWWYSVELAGRITRH